MSSNTVKSRHVGLWALGALHLVLVLCGVLRLRPPAWSGPPGRLLEAYGQWSGASSQFAFFAPEVTPSVRVSFELGLDSGERVLETLATGDDVMNVRTYCLALNFHLLGRHDDLARAWAAKMFGRHPEARSLTLRLEQFRLPSMERYHAGERPGWSERYQAHFERRAPSAARAQAEVP
jgi:hypothetical protein